jgi:hypothetical protein
MTSCLRTLLSAALAATAVASSAGCAGGQSGHEGEASLCEETMTELAAHETSPLGFSPSEVLAVAEGEHTAAFEWQRSSNVPYGPESGPSELTLTVTDLGTYRFVARELRKTSATSEQAGCCPDALQVSVRVALRTAGGALDEAFDAVLEAQSAGAASLTWIIAPPLQGSLTFDQRALGSAELDGVLVEARFGPAGFGGYVDAGFEDAAPGDAPDGAVTHGTMRLAEWGSLDSALMCTE